MTTQQEFQSHLAANEGSHLEFKEAKQNFHFEELVKYCAALANEGGGEIILGVTDRKPRRVVGSQAFADLERTKQGLVERLHLIELGVVESLGRGRGTRYILSRGLYAHLGQKGIYTRKRGLDHETNKELLLRHLLDNAAAGSALAELCQVLPSLSESAVQRLLGELKNENRIRLQGSRRWARWFPVNPKAQNV